MSCTGNPRINLLTGQVTAFTGLCALCHFDLQFIGGIQILRGHAETSRSDLFNSGTAVIVSVFALQTFQTFTAFTGIGLAAYFIHG